MQNTTKELLWNQFGASIDMLENAILMCPIEFWNTKKKFWYNAYHCLFFLDYYLTLNPLDFSPPEPFTDSEFEDKFPERVYTKEELISYLSSCRKKCRSLVMNLTDEMADQRWINYSRTMDYSVLELLIYNLRHVQHHAAQLNLILRQDIDAAPEWVSRAN